MAHREYCKYTKGEVRALLAGIANEAPERITDYGIVLHAHGDDGKCETVIMSSSEEPTAEMGLLVSAMQAVTQEITDKKTARGDENT